MEEAARGGDGSVDGTGIGLRSTAVEAAQICAFLDDGLSQFFAESVSGAGVGVGVRDVVGVDTGSGGGSERDEHVSEEGG